MEPFPSFLSLPLEKCTLFQILRGHWFKAMWSGFFPFTRTKIREITSVSAPVNLYFEPAPAIKFWNSVLFSVSSSFCTALCFSTLPTPLLTLYLYPSPPSHSNLPASLLLFLPFYSNFIFSWSLGKT
jgi:hypothetical protein